MLSLLLAAPCTAQTIDTQVKFSPEVDSTRLVVQEAGEQVLRGVIDLSDQKTVPSHSRTESLQPKIVPLNTIPNHVYGEPPFMVQATSDSPGAITYSLVSGNATVTSAGLVTLDGVGAVTVQAMQAAASYFASATQTASFIVTASPHDFAFANQGPTTGSSAPGKNASYTFSITPLFGSYASAVTFSVMGLPNGTSATFTPSTVASGAGPATVQLYIQTSSQTARQNDKRSTPSEPGIVLAATAVIFTFSSSRRLRQRLNGRMFAFVAMGLGLSGTVFLAGCGSDIRTLASATNYNLSVVATSGTLQHTQNVTLAMQ